MTADSEKIVQEGQTAKKESIVSLPFVILMAVNLFQSMAAYMCNTTLPLYADALGVNTAMVGVMFSAFAVSALLIRPFSGPAFDSFSRKRLLILSQMVIGVCLVAYGVVTSYEGLLVVRLVHGMGIGCVNPLAMSLVSEYLPVSKFASGISIYTLAQSFAQVIGPATGIYLVDTVGFAPSYFLGAASIFLAMIGVFFIREPFRERLPYQLKLSRIFAKEALGQGAALALLSTAFACLNSYVVLYGYARGVEGMGMFFVVYAACLLITRPLFGSLADRVGTPKVLILGIVCFSLSYVCLSVAQDFAGFMLAAVMGSAGFGACAPLLQSFGLSAVPIERRGAASNTTYTGVDLGILIGPIIGGGYVEIASGVLGDNLVAFSQMWLVMIIPIVCTLFLVLYWITKGRHTKTQ